MKIYILKLREYSEGCSIWERAFSSEAKAVQAAAELVLESDQYTEIIEMDVE